MRCVCVNKWCALCLQKMRLLYDYYVMLCWNFIQAVKFLKEKKWGAYKL